MSQSLETNHNASGQREELKILITGDKPKNLLAGNPQVNTLAYSKQMADALEKVSERALNKIVKDNPNKKIVLLSGLELGVEQAAARRALEMGIEIRAFIPHKEHGKNWTFDNQKQYQELTRRIAENGGTVQTSDKEYSPQRTQLRDYGMVDEAHVVVSLHNPNDAPAHQKTLDYAAKHSKTVLNVWTEAEKTLNEISKNFDDKKAQNRTASRIEIRQLVRREDVRAEPDKFFLFGDNLKESGYGGQAKEMRGEANARGIPTKKEPSNRPSSFFSDKEFAANKKAIDEAFGKIPAGKIIVVPKAGIGMGLASLGEKAPQTFAYLNEKLAEIGFDNRRGRVITNAPNNENKVVVQNLPERPARGATRLLDLNNIQTNELKLLSPTREEVDALSVNRSEALGNYATRLRGDYKANKNGLRDGLQSVSDTLDKGDQITVSCSCRGGGEMCHADVVKMAIEKINLHFKSQQIQETSRNAGKENAAQIVGQSANADSQKPRIEINPRTQRAITEILSVSETDKLLEKINQTDGRNQSEQASHLGKVSQFVRDVYERGGNVVGGNLIVPKETLTLSSSPLALTTQDYAVKRLGDILKDESKAKEIAPTIIEHGNIIAGATADGETKLKVFTWMYDALEGKSEFLKSEENARFGENKEQRFGRALSEISRLAEEMHRLEPSDKIEFAPFNDFEQSESVWEHADENRIAEEIYENAVGRDGEGGEHGENLENERGLEQEASGKVAAEGFERIELGGNVAPRLPADFTETETARLLTETLPEIDRQLESGTPVKEILKPFHENVRQSGRIDALNRLETIYQKQKISELETKLTNPNLPAMQKEKLESEVSRWQSLVLTPSWDAQRDILAGVRENEFKGKKTIAQAAGKTGELSQSVKDRISEIDVRHQNVIELKSPSEFFASLGTAEKTFYQKTKIEVANLRVQLEEVRGSKENSEEKSLETGLKKRLNDFRELKPSFAYKLENSTEIIVGRASTTAVEERAFVYSYISFQLKQPETRLRHENERYRIYAAQLEATKNRNELIKTASDIRVENAALGLRWKDLNAGEKEKQPRPLTNREMQFLFTETSPAHHLPEMTVARLTYAHSGESRRQMTEAMLKGEIKPSPEARKLIDSLESRLQRREVKDSMLATKHFFESLKTPNENLKFKNAFCHQEIYRQLPPQEKDFVYQKTTRQKENLEYRLTFRQQELIKSETASRQPQPTLEQSKAEKSFHLLSKLNQARILGDRIENSPLASSEISERDFRAANFILQNQPPEKISQLSSELKQSGAGEDRKIGEILETFSKADITKSGDKTTVEIKLPENSVLGTEIYKELLEKFYPDDARENDKFKFANFNEKSLEDARIKGQNETIKNWQSELGNNFYRADAPAAQIFQTERALAEDLPRVAQMQQTARIARAENAQILEKYASRVAFKIQNQKSSVPSLAEQKQIIKVALDLSSKGAGFPVSSTNQQFFAAAQMEISVSDLQKFGSNEKLIAENQTGIRKTFSLITVKQNGLEEAKIKPAEIRAEDKLADVYFKTQKAEENRLLTVAARTAFEEGAKENLERKSIGDLVSETIKQEIKKESATEARIAVEPENKHFEEKEFEPQALKLADAIEKAHDLSKDGAQQYEINEAFEVAENERTILLQADKRVEKSEDKPASLRIYEAEIKRAEKELWTKNLGAKILAGVDYSESELTLNLDKIFAAPEREQMKVEAAEIAKSRLEPKELDADHRKIPTEAGRQAVATFKQLEQAHNVFQFSNDSVKIREAFARLDTEAATLNKFRQNFDKTEKLALLRDGVKTDLVDLLRKNQNASGAELSERTGEILKQNFLKAGFPDPPKYEDKIETLTREIVEKIEAKQMTIKEKTATPERSAHGFDKGATSGRQEQQLLETNQAKQMKAKEAFVLAR